MVLKSFMSLITARELSLRVVMQIVNSSKYINR
jgi:hypothetical protein